MLLSILPLLAACTKADVGDSPPGDTPSDLIAGTACMTVELDAECPADPPPSDLTLIDCGVTVAEVTGPGVYDEALSWGWDSDLGPGCCYPVLQTEPTCDYGRPLLIEGQPRLAALVNDPAWRAQVVPGDVPPAVRQELVRRWTRAALDEHASVAAFSKVALDLMRFGAPPDLLAKTHQAALDEVRHAQLGFALASAFGGRDIGPGAVRLDAVPLAVDLAQLAREAALEGCIGETLASLLALEGARRAQDPAIRSVLETIAADEQQHGLLAWATVRWAIEQGGDPVRAAVAGVFGDAARNGIAVPQAPELDLSRWGLLSQTDARAVADQCLRQAILPAAKLLLSLPATQAGQTQQQHQRA
jgi:hypothetical protein